MVLGGQDGHVISPPIAGVYNSIRYHRFYRYLNEQVFAIGMFFGIATGGTAA